MSKQAEPDYTHPDESPTVEHKPNPYSDLRGTIVHFTSEMLDNPYDNGIYPTTNFYNDLEQAILDWHNKQVEEVLDRLKDGLDDLPYVNYKGGYQIPYEEIEAAIETERIKLKELK